MRVTQFRDSTPSELDAAMNAFKGSMEGKNLRGLILEAEDDAHRRDLAGRLTPRAPTIVVASHRRRAA